MRLEAKALLSELDQSLQRTRQRLSVRPGLALVWVGSDEQTARFVRQKQQYAKILGCDFHLHRFEAASDAQIAALIASLNSKKTVHGIVLQLPLPKSFDADRLIGLISPAKDIDNLGGGSEYVYPTPEGIIALLQRHNIDLAKTTTAIIGRGRLVGGPICEIFDKFNWPHNVIDRNAASHASVIRSCQVMIAASGVTGLITPEMVNSSMTVIDGSGVDVDVEKIEPLVKAITPPKGAIGPLTVRFLFQNLLKAAQKIS